MKNNLPKYKNKLLIIFLMAIWQFSSGQAIVNTGQLVQTGNYVVLNSGTKWQNNGTANLQNGSNVYFSGNADQDIDGTSSTAFANLRVNNSGTHGVTVKRNIQVLGTLTMSTGYLDLKNYEVDMSSSGTLTGETETSRVRATDALWNEGGGSGKLKATRTNPTGNVAGFGLNFTPSTNMGSTVIYRGHQSQTGTNLTSSIFRYFELQPATYATLSLNPLSYFDAELNGISPESGLLIVQLYNSSNYWQQQATTLNTTTNQAVGNTTSNSLSNIKVTLAKSPCTILASTLSNSPICSGVTLNLNSSATNGYGTLSYNWTGPNGFTSVSQNPSIAAATTAASGTYNVTITDELNCSATSSVVVTVNQTPTANAGTDVTIPFGTSTTLTGSATNGSGNYSYSWSPVDSLVNATVQNPTTVNLEATTTFTLTVTDNTSSCTATDQVIVTINGGPLNVVVSANPTVICLGSSTQLLATASGGSGSYTYSWSSNPAGYSNNTYNPTVSPVTTTTYTVTVDDGFNTVSGSVTVTVNPLPTVSAGSDTAICAGNPITLSGSGTNNYAWDNGVSDNVPFTPSTTTTYTVTGTDANSCTNTDQVTVTVNPLPNVVANASSNMICNGNSVTLTGSGTATSYVWDNSVTDGVSFTPTTTNTYTVTGTDANSCSSTDQITVTVNPVYLYNESAGICNGQPYIWHGNTYTAAGTYYDSLTTTNGCDSVYILTLDVGAAFTYTDNYSTCQGQSYLWHGQNYSTTGMYYDSLQTVSGCDSIFILNLTVNQTYNYDESYTICQGSSYTWHGNTYNTSGDYNDNLTTIAGCDSIFVLHLSVNPTYTITENHNICQGDSLLWHGNYYSLSGNYYDSLTAITGCDSVIVLNLTTTPLPDVTIQAQSNTICQGESTSLTASGAGTYLWITTETNATITVNPTNTTTYFVVGTNNGCSDSAYVTITVNPLPNINIVADHQAVCPGSTVVITASGADSYIWSNTELTSTITVNPQNTTNYTVTGTLSGCTNTASTQIIVQPSYNTTQNAQMCDGSVYPWNGNNYTSSGTYTLNFQTVNGCDSILNLQLAVNPKPVISINTTDTLIVIGNAATLTVNGDATSFVWIPTTGLSCNNCSDPSASPDSTTEYCVIGSNTSGCSDTACIVITVDNDCGELFIPLAFSPNGDNHNDTWKVQGRCIKTFELMIYDRWGEKIFETSNQNDEWDGTYKGKALDTDVYVYTLNITMRDGEVKNLKGDITLMK